MELQDVMAIFYKDEGQLMRLKVDRNGINFIVSFRLEDML